MSRVVVSVGGTGQHIALALTRLVKMGALASDIQLIAIDPDNQSDLPKTLEAPAGMRGERHPLRMSHVYAPFDVVNVGASSFDKMFLDVDHPEETDLFETLFDAESASIPISKGMYGTPSVGATVFAQGANSAGLRDLLEPLKNADAVFVCGSVVGGTGAGIMHKLILEILKYHPKSVFGIFMLPWFELGASGGAKGAITPALIQRNAKHGIKFLYEHTIPRLTASLLIGYPGTTQEGVLKRITAQEGVAGEMPHYLHLAAAHAMVSLPKGYTSHYGVKAYGMVHDTENPGWLLDADWEGKSLRRLVRAHKVQLNLLQFVITPSNRKKILGYYGSNAVVRVLGDHDSWGDLHGSIVNNQGSKAQQLEFATGVMNEFERIAGETKYCVDWIDQLFPGELSKLPQDQLLDHLVGSAAAGGESGVHWPRIAAIWKGHALQPDATFAQSPERVARHHADLLLSAGLSAVS